VPIWAVGLGHAGGVKQPPIFVFEGPGELSVSRSLAAAEGQLGAVDVENGEYEIFAADGTRIGPRPRVREWF
jgi:hypothetical protein